MDILLIVWVGEISLILNSTNYFLKKYSSGFVRQGKAPELGLEYSNIKQKYAF